MQPKAMTAEVYLDALWTYTLGLARAGVEEVQDKPSTVEPDGSQTHDYVQFIWNEREELQLESVT